MSELGATRASGPTVMDVARDREDVLVGGVWKHTLYIANDNDFLSDVTLADGKTLVRYDNQFFVFAFDASDLGGNLWVFTIQSATQG